MPADAQFTDEDVDAAIDFVVSHGAEDRAQTISYSRVFEAAGLAAPQELHQGGDSHVVNAFMERFHHRCRERTLPPLDALVVHVAGPRRGFPGGGYFTVNGFPDPRRDRTEPERVVQAQAFWDSEIAQCRSWGQRSRRGQS